MVDVNEYSSLINQDRAGQNLNGSQGVSRSSAVTAFKSQPEVGVDPSLGMQDPETVGTLATQRRDQQFLDLHPPIAAFASRSPAHVAATKEDWGNFASLLRKVNETFSSDLMKPINEALARSKEQDIKTAGAITSYRPSANPFGILGPVGEVGKSALAGVDAAAAVFLKGPINALVARPLSMIPGPTPEVSMGKPTGRMLTQPEVQAQYAGLLTNWMLGFGVSPGRLRTPPTAPGNLRLPPPTEGAAVAGEAPKPPTPPPAPSPVEQAQARVDAAKGITEAITATSTHKELPSVMGEFLDDVPELSGRSVWVDPQAVLQLYGEGHTPLPQFSVQIGEALNSGRDVQLPMSAYLADIAGKPYEDALMAATRFDENAPTLSEAKELPEPVQEPSIEERIGRLRSDVQAAQQADANRPLTERDIERRRVLDEWSAAEEGTPEATALAERYNSLLPTEAELMQRAQGELEAIQQNLPEGWTARRRVITARDNTTPERIAIEIFDPEGNVVFGGAFGLPGNDLLQQMFEGRVQSPIQAVRAEMRRDGVEPANDMDLDELARVIGEREQTGEVVEFPRKEAASLPEDITEAEVPRELPAKVDFAVEEVFAELSLKQLFTDAKALKLTKPRFARYDDMLAEAKAELTEKLLNRTYEQIRKERTPEWKDRVAQHTAEAEKELAGDRAVAAMMELQYGEGPLGEPLERPGLKFDRSAVVEAFGAETVLQLPNSMFSASEGLHPDDVAPLLGYDTGEELLSDLLDLEALREARGAKSSRELVKGLVRETAETRAREELGYDISREGLKQAALDAVVLPTVEDFLADNLKALAEEVGLPFDKAAVEALAKHEFDQLTVKEGMNVRAFERGMWKLGNRTQVALEKGDWPAAFIGRQQQLLNFYQLKMSHFLKRKVEVGHRKFARLARKNTIRGLSQPFLDQLHRYLPGFGYSTKREVRELEEALGGVTLQEFVDNIRATDAQFPTVPEVVPQDMRDLLVDDYWKVREFIYAMDRYGRELQELRIAGGREEFNVEVARAIMAAPPAKPPPPVVRINQRQTFPEWAAKIGRKYDASHRKVADMVEWLDRGDPFGVFAQVFTHPMSEAADRQGDRKSVV